MKTAGKIKFLIPFCFLLIIITVMNSCKKNDNSNNNNTIEQSFSQVNLVANSSSYAGARVDPNLINAWGIAFNPTGNAWISSTGSGVTVVYDKTGAQLLAPVAIPAAGAANGGAITGQVFNGTADFILNNGNPAKFIFAGADGIISGWNSGGSAERKINNSANAAYTGLALATYGAVNYIYASNFLAGTIDVFDKNFAAVTMPFTDPNLPAGYSPFNVQNVGGLLYVMYAKADEITHEEQKGPGLGYIDIYNHDGSFVKRFASQGELNAPWGITQAPPNFLGNSTGEILIGNFGDGRINAFDNSGNFIKSLKSNGNIIQIAGLWAITFAPATATTIDANWLFFTAGPNDEHDGLFGYIKK